MILMVNLEVVMVNGEVIKFSFIIYRLLKYLVCVGGECVFCVILVEVVWGEDVLESNVLKVYIYYLCKVLM